MSSGLQSLIIAHRGDTRTAPENTISAAQSALESGATGLETDIRICSSGELVLYHDKTLLRHFNRYSPVCMKRWDYLKNLKYSHPEKPYGIDLLADYLEHFRQTVPLILDVKTLCGRHIKLVRKLIRLIEQLEMQDQVWISAFDPLILKIIKQLRPNLRTGFLFSRFSRLYQSLDIMLDSDSWHAHHSLINDRLVQRAKELKKQIFVWTINDLETFRRLSGYKFEGIITDSLYREPALYPVRKPSI